MSLLTDRPSTAASAADRAALARAGGICGLAFAAAQLVAGLLPGTPPSLDEPGALMARYLVDHRTGILAAGVVNALGGLLVIAFLLALADRVEDESRRPLVLGAGLAAVAVSLAATAIGVGAAAASRAAAPLEPSVATFALHTQTIGFLMIGIPAAVLVGIGSRGLGRRSRRLGAVTVAVMIGSQVAVAAADLAVVVLVRDLLFAGWLVAAAVTLLRDDSRWPEVAG